MLRNGIFSKSAGYTGVLAHGFGLTDYIAFALAPALVLAPLSLSAIKKFPNVTAVKATEEF